MPGKEHEGYERPSPENASKIKSGFGLKCFPKMESIFGDLLDRRVIFEPFVLKCSKEIEVFAPFAFVASRC